MTQQTGVRSKLRRHVAHAMRGRLLRHTRLARFAVSARGNVAIITGVALPVLLGAGALAIDASNLYVVRNQLQAAADSGSLAGAIELSKSGSSYEDACDKALAFAKQNIEPHAEDDGRFLEVELGTWDKDRTRKFEKIASCAFQPTSVSVPADETPNAVRVLTLRTEEAGNAVNLTLAAIFDRQFANVRARATAALANTRFENVCVLALNGNLRLSGKPELDAPNCGFATNQTLDVDGQGGGVTQERNVGSIIYENLDGSGSDNPSDLFADPFADNPLNGGRIKNPHEGKTAQSLADACSSDNGSSSGGSNDSNNGNNNSNNSNNNGNNDNSNNNDGGNKVCTLDPGLYKVEGSFSPTGNIQYRRSDNEGDGSGIVKIWATGDIDAGGTVDFEGCFNFVGASVRLHGNPGFECDEETPDPVEVENVGVSLVQ